MEVKDMHNMRRVGSAPREWAGAHQSVGELLQAVAGGGKDASEEPALTEFCEP